MDGVPSTRESFRLDFDHAIGNGDNGWVMSDDDAGLVCDDLAQGFDEAIFSFTIQRGARLVQEQYGRIFE